MRSVVLEHQSPRSEVPNRFFETTLHRDTNAERKLNQIQEGFVSLLVHDITASVKIFSADGLTPAPSPSRSFRLLYYMYFIYRSFGNTIRDVISAHYNKMSE